MQKVVDCGNVLATSYFEVLRGQVMIAVEVMAMWRLARKFGETIKVIEMSLVTLFSCDT